jgi:hypothetical protein
MFFFPKKKHFMHPEGIFGARSALVLITPTKKKNETKTQL